MGWPRSSFVSDPVRATHFPSLRRNVSSAQKLLLGKCFLGICQFHDVQSALLMLPRTQRTAESKVAARVRGIPTTIIPGFAVWHARTVASCASASVTSHISPNSGRQKDSVTCSLDSTAFFRHRALSSFINQLEAGLLVHAFQLHLHFRRHEVSSSPKRTKYSSSSSNLALSTRRTSHPCPVCCSAC